MTRATEFVRGMKQTGEQLSQIYFTFALSILQEAFKSKIILDKKIEIKDMENN